MPRSIKTWGERSTKDVEKFFKLNCEQTNPCGSRAPGQGRGYMPSGSCGQTQIVFRWCYTLHFELTAYFPNFSLSLSTKLQWYVHLRTLISIFAGSVVSTKFLKPGQKRPCRRPWCKLNMSIKVNGSFPTRKLLPSSLFNYVHVL